MDKYCIPHITIKTDKEGEGIYFVKRRQKLKKIKKMEKV